MRKICNTFPKNIITEYDVIGVFRDHLYGRKDEIVTDVIEKKHSGNKFKAVHINL